MQQLPSALGKRIAGTCAAMAALAATYHLSHQCLTVHRGGCSAAFAAISGVVWMLSASQAFSSETTRKLNMAAGALAALSGILLLP